MYISSDLFSMREIEALRSILERVLQQAHSHPVTEVNLVLGELAEITDVTIRQLWNELSRGTLAEQARLHIRLIQAEVQCMACFQKYHPSDRQIRCPYCGSFGAKILAGEECFLESIELDHP